MQAVEKMKIGEQAEDAAEAVLTAAGWEVINLNRLARNFRFADLLAKRGSTRLLVQVKGTTTDEGKFGAQPEPARALHALQGLVADVVISRAVSYRCRIRHHRETSAWVLLLSASSRTWSGPRRRETSASPPGSGSPSCPAR